MKKTVYIAVALLLALSLAGCGYRATIAELEDENNSLNEQISGLEQESALLASSLDELLSATPEPTAEPLAVSLGVTPDQLNENIIYLLENSFTMLDPLPAPEEGTSANGNRTMRYQLSKDIYMLYTLNFLGEAQSVELSYDFSKLSEKEEGKYGNYGAVIINAYVMALESPLDYSGAVAFKANDIIMTGSYLDGKVIMMAGIYPNRHVTRLYADFN